LLTTWPTDKGVDGGKLVEQVRALVAKHEKA
jgi:hypothetical protein